ncbi:MAG: hypothetical protein E6J77_03390 [Deltaproteobacteria bacterium]|nr:MAG: hypothetical protein E6J77_03390 [Deltaproteobacteria bacterium]
MLTGSSSGSVARALVALVTVVPLAAQALSLDDRGEIRLGLRAYTAARIGTEQEGGSDNPLSFPASAPGHVHQHRYFLEVKFDHDMTRLVTGGRGLARLFAWLQPSSLKYSLQYRGEGEGIYDYGPSEFRNQGDTLRAVQLDLPTVPGLLSPKVPEPLIDRRIERLRRLGRQRHQFFLGYLDVEKGPVFLRVGRQILAWGETDVFRLLDNINPLDSSFGGFLIALDERRVPLDMLRASYRLGQLGPLSDAFLEGFGALGNKTSSFPGVPQGSPWEPGGLGFPNPALRFGFDIPARHDFRGGARLVFNHHDVTYTLAHYYTYLDTPGVRFRLPGGTPNTPRFGHEILADVKNPRVPITGASLTFPLPAYYAVVRSESAYFQGEPLNRQGQGNSADSLGTPGSPGFKRLQRANNIEGGLDPFVYPGFLDLSRTQPVEGRVLQRDTFNFALGLDVNRFIRWLNPAQTFLFTTQFFYKHVFDSPGDLVLPVPFRNIPVDRSIPIIGTGCGVGTRACQLRPRLFHLADDQLLHTFNVSTSYYGGRVVPSYSMFYDWQGSILLQPGVMLVRDPFRYVFDYTRIEGPPTGQIGTLRDRDNVRVQVEYVF